MVEAEVRVLAALVEKHKRAQQALADERNQLAETQHLAQVGSWWWDPKTDTVRWSDELYRIAGRDPRSRAPNYNEHQQVYTPESWERLRLAVEKALSTGEPYELDLELVRSDGTTRWLIARGQAQRDAEGRVRYLHGTVKDITERKRSEEALRDSEERLRLAVRAGKMFAFEWDTATDTITRSESVADISFLAGDPLRISKQELLSKVHPEDRAAFEISIAESTPERPDHQICFRLLRPDGSYVWLERTAHAFFDEQGKMVRMIGMVADVNERKQYEHSLLWRLELGGMLSDLSRTFINLPEEEIDANVGRSLARVGEFLEMDRITLFEFSPDRTDVVTAYTWAAAGVAKAHTTLATADLPWWSGRISRGEESRITQSDDMPTEASAEKEFLRRNGIVSAATIPLKVGGEVNGGISFLTVRRHVTWTDDLTNQLKIIGDIFWNALKRKQAMETLLAAQANVRSSEERFRIVANTAPVMIWMSGVDKLRTYFNRRWLEFTGRPLQAELGNGWTQVVHPEDLQRYLRTYTKAFDQRELFDIEYRLRRHDGEYRWIFAQGVPRFNADRSFAGYIGSCFDITERKLAERALSTLSQKLIEAQEQERSRLARELHDDICQRLAVLGLNVDRLKQDLPAASTKLGILIGETSREIADIGKDVQALSHRFHSPKLELLGLAAATRSFCVEFADSKQVEVSFHSEDVPKQLPPEVSLCLFRVLQEALQNAAKHSGSRHFEVALNGEGNGIGLTVRDFGIGFKPEEAMRGRGLGVTSMKERLKLVDGGLSIDSRLQRGTTVYARVPLHPRTRSATGGG